MPATMKILGCFLLLAVPLSAQPVTSDEVKAEFLHAWKGYKQFAWGHDALKPLSRQPHDWYGVSLLMTPVDAFDTMVLMGLSDESREAKHLIFQNLSFDRDVEVQAFEIIIRLLGGLLSAYQLDGDARWLALAEDLGKRLLPVFDSPTGLPYRYVNFRTGVVRDSINNPAEIGTSILEFGMLSRLTGNPVYYERSKRALVELFARRSDIGLVGSAINVETGAWVGSASHIGGGIDSYYEYLLKAHLLFGDQKFLEMYRASVSSVNTYLADTVRGELWYGHADKDTGRRTRTRYGALDAFFPGVLLLGGDTARARGLQESGWKMWNLHGIEPEGLDYSTMTVTSPGYPLRPEIIESAYYLYRATGDDRYRKMGEEFFRGLVRHCRTSVGYAALKDVRTKEQANEMESFFFAETLKYLYLLFAPDDVLPFGSVVFTTEAHPLRKVRITPEIKKSEE